MLKEEVDSEDIAEVVSKWTGISVTKLMEGEKDKLVRLESYLGKRVIGQEEAILAVSNAVRRARSGLQDQNRPLGSFIFMGPTGVGKTELVKALAEFLFDTDEAMIRIDMSEYMEKHSVSRMIGAPPGYVGYEEGGHLTEAVRRKPYSVLLFDEIEKAHRDVFNVLLQILDEGRLTDGQGRTVDFRNTLIVMTSNIGSQWILEYGIHEQEKFEEKIRETLQANFSPEFLNRIDETIIFKSLTADQITSIVTLQVNRLNKRLSEKNINLILSDEAKAFLGQKGYDPVFGARPLKRAIQRYLENPLAMEILKGNIIEGKGVETRVENDQILFSESK
jgi:ATP-dependent Clp protease ATP-binding subunit ClpB